MGRNKEEQEDLETSLDLLHKYLNRNNDKNLDGFYSVVIPRIKFEGWETTIYRFNLIDYSYEVISE